MARADKAEGAPIRFERVYDGPVEDLWALVHPDLPPVAEQQEMPEGEAATPENPCATVPPPPAEAPALAADPH